MLFVVVNVLLYTMWAFWTFIYLFNEKTRNSCKNVPDRPKIFSMRGTGCTRSYLCVGPTPINLSSRFHDLIQLRIKLGGFTSDKGTHWRHNTCHDPNIKTAQPDPVLWILNVDILQVDDVCYRGSDVSLPVNSIYLWLVLISRNLYMWNITRLRNLVVVCLFVSPYSRDVRALANNGKPLYRRQLLTLLIKRDVSAMRL